ncbi:MAG TPA: Ig-like domain-containing protein [Candidatus Sulfopaludibacter sp.]|jgi:hypothetical protein|nr:Ig-like domain-containing protein [Candidatus Sulfopaludibacter sp.]
MVAEDRVIYYRRIKRIPGLFFRVRTDKKASSENSTQHRKPHMKKQNLVKVFLLGLLVSLVVIFAAGDTYSLTVSPTSSNVGTSTPFTVVFTVPAGNTHSAGSGTITLPSNYGSISPVSVTCQDTTTAASCGTWDVTYPGTGQVVTYTAHTGGAVLAAGDAGTITVVLSATGTTAGTGLTWTTLLDQNSGGGGTALTLTGPAATTSVAPAVDTTTSTVVAGPTSVVANGASTSTITVTLLNAGNPVSGKTVTLAGTGSSTITTVSGTTNASGQATFTVKDTHVESVTYTATDTTDSLVLTNTASVNFTVGPASTTTSTVTASPTSATANGTSTSTITVTLLDASSNPISGKTVTLAGTGSSTITTVSGTTNASGQATFTVKDTHVESVTYTATDTTDSLALTNTASVNFTVGAASPTTSTVTASLVSVPADGTSTSLITVTLKDAGGDPISGKTVTLAGTGSSTITTVSGTTNASGQATFTVKDSHIESVTYTATDTTDSLALTNTVMVAFGTATVPTLSEGMLIALGLMLATWSLFLIGREQKTASI